MAKLNVRSPYFINLNRTNLTTVKLEIQIYFGVANTSWQSSPQYILNSTAINAKVNFEIAELVKDYIDTEFDGAFPTVPVSLTEATTIFVDYKTTETLSSGSPVVTEVLGNRAFYGYGYFEDGANPSFNNIYSLQSNNTIIKNTNATVTIPVDNTIATSLVWKYQGSIVGNISITAETKIENQITYVTSTGISNVDQAEISTGAKTTTVNIQSYEKCKYTPIKLTFINKFGAYQEIWMFANSILSMATNEERYKSNILTNGTYNTYNPQIKILTKNANQTLKLNSDYYPESYNEVFRQLFLSEKVWIDYEGQTLGVNIENKQITYKTSLTDSLINYTIDVSFAFDTINNIR
jgi:hypothetical protein